MKITICIGSSCHLKGSRQIVEELQRLVKENQLEWKPRDSVCRLQPSAVHRESFGQSTKKSWQVISRKTEKVSPLLYLLILSLADSAQKQSI